MEGENHKWVDRRETRRDCLRKSESE